MARKLHYIYVIFWYIILKKSYGAAAQSNYSRCMKRSDVVAAEFCRSKGIDAAINIAFLIEKKYAPYYKWKLRALKDIEDMAGLPELLKEAALCPLNPEIWKDRPYDASKINTDDSLTVIFEKIAAFLVEKLKTHGLTQSDDTFLEAQCRIIASSIK